MAKRYSLKGIEETLEKVRFCKSQDSCCKCHLDNSGICATINDDLLDITEYLLDIVKDKQVNLDW